MRPAQGGNHLVVTVVGEDRLQAELRNALLPPTLADGRRRALAAEERPRALGVPRAALVLADPPGAGREDCVAHRVQSLRRDERHELAAHRLVTQSCMLFVLTPASSIAVRSSEDAKNIRAVSASTKSCVTVTSFGSSTDW